MTEEMGIHCSDVS